MEKTLLTERFQELAGIKPLAEQPTMMDLGDMQRQGIGPYADKDNKKMSADAGKLANSPILNQINTRDEWVEAMDILMKKANDIDQVSDSVKRTWLQNALKAI
jgi:hypothetical protein